MIVAIVMVFPNKYRYQQQIEVPKVFTMKYIITILLGLLLNSQAYAQKKPLRRVDSFFGLHFDFHASAGDTLVGKTLTEGMIDSLLTAVKPDFIQVDSKGHPGVTSYPTKVAAGTQVKSFAKNPLELFRKVTQKHGVALYVHYSGVYDDAALLKHPEWAAIDVNGKPSTQKNSVHGKYANELMIPQLKEIADYGVDGVWVDGDCWATVVDYSASALEKFKAQTGILTIPKNRKDAHYQDFLNFSRQSFLDYVGHYTDEVHKYKPTFQIASNWAFSSFMPEPVKLNIDFMSGDLTPMNGVNSALFESRVLATQSRVYKKPWDLMSWSFNTSWDNMGNQGQKTAVNLNQEAAEVIATGGGYQCYFTQNRDASIRVQQVKRMTELAKFVRARQPFTQGAQAIPQIGLLYSLASFRKYTTAVYGNGVAEHVRGILAALMDGQQTVEVLAEHHLTGNLPKYPIIVVPEWIYLEENFKQELKTYVQNGGNLLVIGAEATKNFADALQVSFVGSSRKQRFWVNVADDMGLANDSLQTIRVSADSQVLGRYFFNEDTRFPVGVSASMARFGKGKIAGIYFDLGRSYQRFQSPVLRDFLNGIVRQLFTKPVVEVEGSKQIHVTLNDLKGKLSVNLINAGGQHNSDKIHTYDELPALTNLTVRIRTPQPPKRIIQQPENRPLTFSYANGVAIIQVPKLDIHSVLLVE